MYVEIRSIDIVIKINYKHTLKFICIYYVGLGIILYPNIYIYEVINIVTFSDILLTNILQSDI